MAKILLIEDDPLVVKMYRNVLSFGGFKMETAPNGAEGLKKAGEFKPDLIFLDIMMPKMNGIEVLENLKKNPDLRGIPVIMLTNLAGADNAEEALKKGAFAYMVKSEYKPKEVALKAKEFFDKKGVKMSQQAQGSMNNMTGMQVQSQKTTANDPNKDKVKLHPPVGEKKEPMVSAPTPKSDMGTKNPSVGGGDSMGKTLDPTPSTSSATISSATSDTSGPSFEDKETQPGGAVQPPPPLAPKVAKTETDTSGKDTGLGVKSPVQSPKPKADLGAEKLKPATDTALPVVSTDKSGSQPVQTVSDEPKPTPPTDKIPNTNTAVSSTPAPVASTPTPEMKKNKV